MGKVVTLGEIMLRLSTEQGTRIDSSERFAAHYGGGEANVAISLANYRHDAVFATKVPDNALGKAVKKALAMLWSRYETSIIWRAKTRYLLYGNW